MPPKAILAALRHVWLTLKPLDIPMAILGGIALAAWKYVRATKDVDLLLAAGPDDPQRLLEALWAAGIRSKRPGPATRIGRLELLQFLYEPPETFLDIQVDLLLARSDYHHQALARRVPLELPDLGVDLAVLACEDLILHKLLSERIIDQADTVALLRLNRQSLDLAYLRHWAAGLQVGPGLAEAWRAAWPGEPLPL
jgi:hypothetical protein